MYLGKAHTSSNISWHRPQSVESVQEEELMQSSARGVSSATSPLDKLRLVCLSRGAAGIMLLGRVFRKMDEDDNKTLDKNQFTEGLKQFGADITDEEIDQLFNMFEIEDSGHISLGEFFNHLRPPMSEGRRDCVRRAFHKMDVNGRGALSVEDIRRTYCVTNSPRYKSGEETSEVVMDNFLEHFEGNNSDGYVTLDEFMNYYSGVGATIDTDCYFDLMMRQSYNL